MIATHCSTTERLGAGPRTHRQTRPLPVTGNGVPPFTLFSGAREAASFSGFSASKRERRAMPGLTGWQSLAAPQTGVQTEPVNPEIGGLQFRSYSTTRVIGAWDAEHGNNPMQRLPRHISLSRICANRCYQTNLETHLGHIQKRTFLNVSSSGSPPQNFLCIADRRGRMAA